MQPYLITNAIIDENGGYDACTHEAVDGSYRAIRKDKVDGIADSLMMICADLIASLIDAGSEREAVLESDGLRDAIVNELNEWSA